ncbi:MAG: hypothetical protein ACI308_03500 [Muribaculaceae bacterium]
MKRNNHILSVLAIGLAALASTIGIKAQTAENYLTCEGATIDRDEVKNVDVALVNAVDFTAFQCDITIPATLKFVATNGKYIIRSERMGYSHVIEENLIDQSHLRVLVYSTTNAVFDNFSQSLFSYAVAAVNPEESSNSQTDITNIIFSQIDNSGENPMCVEHKFADLAINTAVSGIASPSVSKMQIYASGRSIIVISPSDTVLNLTNTASITVPLNVKTGKNAFSVPQPGVYIVGQTKLIVK